MKETVVAETFPAGRLQQGVTEVVLVNNVTKTIDTTVPAGKKWVLLGIKVTNPDDVQRSVNLFKYKEAAKTNLIKYYGSEAFNAAELVFYPSAVPTATGWITTWIPLEVLVAGNTISIVWSAGGASAGGTDADGLVIEYLELDA